MMINCLVKKTTTQNLYRELNQKLLLLNLVDYKYAYTYLFAYTQTLLLAMDYQKFHSSNEKRVIVNMGDI